MSRATRSGCEIEAFLESDMRGAPAVVSGEDGLRALETALRITEIVQGEGDIAMKREHYPGRDLRRAVNDRGPAAHGRRRLPTSASSTSRAAPRTR